MESSVKQHLKIIILLNDTLDLEIILRKCKLTKCMIRNKNVT